MTIRAWALEMALYGRWQNDGVFERCDGLGETERRRHRGMFFGSIHDTLDHVLMADRFLLDVVVHRSLAGVFDPERKVYSDWYELARARRAFDEDLVALLEDRSDAWLDETFTFESERLGRPRTVPRHFYLAQMFNHATHHRSQVTSALHAMGVDYGNTDLPHNPASQY